MALADLLQRARARQAGPAHSEHDIKPSLAERTRFAKMPPSEMVSLILACLDGDPDPARSKPRTSSRTLTLA